MQPLIKPRTTLHVADIWWEAEAGTGTRERVLVDELEGPMLVLHHLQGSVHQLMRDKPRECCGIIQPAKSSNTMLLRTQQSQAPSWALGLILMPFRLYQLTLDKWFWPRWQPWHNITKPVRGQTYHIRPPTPSDRSLKPLWSTLLQIGCPFLVTPHELLLQLVCRVVSCLRHLCRLLILCTP
jgi:hypothetical protein